MTSIATYFRDSVRELELVTWPTRQQAVRLSGIVLVFTVASALVFGLIDFAFSSVLYALLSSAL